MRLNEVFDRLGLPKHSAEIFTTLEKKGPSSISALAQAVHTHRPAIYRALDALVTNGFVSEKKFGKRSYCSAESRAKISQAFGHAQKEVEKLAEKDVRESMGTVRYFEGQRCVTAVFNDLVEHSKKGSIFYRYTSEKDLDEVNRLLPPDYRKRRDAKRLERLVISNPESGMRKKQRLERFIKYLGVGKEEFRMNAIQLIYGDRIAFIDLNSYKAFIIENKSLADFQTTIFRALYKRL